MARKSKNIFFITSKNYQVSKMAEFTVQPIGFMFRKRSPLVEQFNRIILERMARINKLLDVKLGQECHDHFYPEEASVKAGYTPLGLIATSGAFALWLFLILVAMLIVLCEYTFAAIQRANLNGANEGANNICSLPCNKKQQN
jgi:hypothetical protein